MVTQSHLGNKPPPGAERRRSERFELLAQVELEVRGEVSVLPIVNISAGGGLLRVEQGELRAVALDDQVTVFVDISDLPEPISVTMEATVVRLLTSGSSLASIAVMWTSTDGGSVAQLAKLLDYVRDRQRVLGDGQP